MLYKLVYSIFNLIIFGFYLLSDHLDLNSSYNSAMIMLFRCLTNFPKVVNFKESCKNLIFESANNYFNAIRRYII